MKDEIMKNTKSLKEQHLRSGNIFISYTVVDDKLAEELGYNFLGVSTVDDEGEVHIWEIVSYKNFVLEN